MCGGEGGGDGDGEVNRLPGLGISEVGEVVPVLVSIANMVTPDPGGLGGGEVDVPPSDVRSISVPVGASSRLSCCLVSFSTSLVRSGRQVTSLKQGRISRESDKRSKLEQTKWAAQ